MELRPGRAGALVDSPDGVADRVGHVAYPDARHFRDFVGATR